MKYKLSRIVQLLNLPGTFNAMDDTGIKWLAVDSRMIFDPAHTLFFALKGSHTNGHQFINELLNKGVKYFIVQEEFKIPINTSAVFLQVKQVLSALQTLVRYHRNQFHYPILAITGSNGKTTVKEWLVQLLGSEYFLVSTPKSYNSQIGVPLSVWEMNSKHELGIFEAGISQVNEMEKLEQIIQPDIGILTNIGSAHDAFFKNRYDKTSEKLKLFIHAKQLIISIDQVNYETAIADLKKINPDLNLVKWSYKDKSADVWIEIISKDKGSTQVIAHFRGKDYPLTLPFKEMALLENAGHCLTFVLFFCKTPENIFPLFESLSLSPLRLELKPAINRSTLIYDCYNSDLKSLALAMSFMNQQAGKQKRTLIFSDILQSGKEAESIYAEVIALMEEYHINRFIGLGKEIKSCRKLFNIKFDCSFFDNTEQLISALGKLKFDNECILIKGARAFKMETIGLQLESMAHNTVLEVNLSAMAYNLNWFRSKLNDGVQTMVMVKASAYGSGIREVSRLLEFHGIDYMGVAYADEGIMLRNEGVKTRIMVINSSYADFSHLLKYRLEPEMYSMNQLKRFIDFIPENEVFPIHLKLNTGMNRLGFDETELESALKLINASKDVRVSSILTHLAASENKSLDDFTQKQLDKFERMCSKISNALTYQPMKHVLNSGGIIRFPEYQYDMVRLGIGLYGIDPTGLHQNQLENLFSLRTTISQIRMLNKGECIGYSAKYIVPERTRIATLSIGYADGYPRALSQGKGKVLIKGQLYPIVGNICMDMCMIDLGLNDEINEGDRAILFGSDLTAMQLADWANTIPYDIFSGLSSRIRRIYFEE